MAQRRGQLFGYALATALAEDPQFLALMLVVAHILHHAPHPHRHLQRHQAGTHRNIRSGRLRRGHHHQFGIRQRLCHRNRHIAGAGRKIEQQHIRLAPPHIGQELLQRALQSGSAPQDRTVRAREHAD